MLGGAQKQGENTGRKCLLFLAAIIKCVHHPLWSRVRRQEYGIGQQEMYVQRTRHITPHTNVPRGHVDSAVAK